MACISGKAELITRGKLHQIGRDLLYKKYPKYEEDYPIEEGGSNKYILVITPTKVISWGLQQIACMHMITLSIVSHMRVSIGL